MTTDLNHRPAPGPMYWDYRCLKCGEPVIVHPRLGRRLWRRIREFFRIDEDLFDPYPEDRP